jgi:hypothetical protein
MSFLGGRVPTPPKGAVIAYHLPAPAAQLTLVISDAAGNELRRFVSKKDDKDDKELRLPNNAGWNRFVWDTRSASAAKVKGSDPISEAEFVGPRVVPGTYALALHVDDTVVNGSVTLISEPTIGTSQDDLAAQVALQTQVHQLIDRTVTAINTMRDLRAQLAGWEERAAGQAHLVERCKQLREQVLEIEKTLAVPDLRPGWGDAFTYGSRLLERISSLPDVIELGDYKPTDAAIEVYHDLKGRIETQLERLDDLKAEELPTLNAALAAAGFGIVA